MRCELCESSWREAPMEEKRKVSLLLLLHLLQLQLQLLLRRHR